MRGQPCGVLPPNDGCGVWGVYGGGGGGGVGGEIIPANLIVIYGDKPPCGSPSRQVFVTGLI